MPAQLDPYRMPEKGPVYQQFQGFTVFACPRLVNWYPQRDLHDTPYLVIRDTCLAAARLRGAGLCEDMQPHRRWVVRAYINEDISTDQFMALMAILDD